MKQKTKCPIVYTKTSACVLDIGLMVDPNSDEGVIPRATMHSPNARFGACLQVHWIESGKYCTEEEWQEKTYEKNTEDICMEFGIPYRFKQSEEEKSPEDQAVRLNDKELQLLEGALLKINREYERLYWNFHQRRADSPMENSGSRYKNSVFVMRAYDWSDDEDEPNFEYKSLKVWWYKRMGRGMSAKIDKKDWNLQFFAEMIDDCIRAMRSDPNLGNEAAAAN